MKNLLIILITISSYVSFSQNSMEERTYLSFDSSNQKTYIVEVDGKKIEEKFFIKENKENGKIVFYIGGEMFIANKKETDTCNLKSLENIKMSDINELKKIVSIINPLYPYKVFPNLYIVEKVNNKNSLIKYKVKWQYYIE